MVRRYVVSPRVVVTAQVVIAGHDAVRGAMGVQQRERLVDLLERRRVGVLRHVTEVSHEHDV
ncbi:hypothetical protein [Streptomyces sp. NPDC017991]|uniref:hypothetical protein n=1 Tax=Streptomyces sp. NPDC017991 TaxID=3365026 RepID=UPI00379470E0